MNNDIIELLNLEDSKERIKKITTEKINNILYYTIVLNVQRGACPVCDSIHTIIHGYSKKKIVHSNNTMTKSFIIYNARRFKCKQCEHTFYERNPFTFANERISILTTQAILRDLKAQNETFSNVGERYNVSAVTATRIFDQYVDVAPGKPSRIMCFDETMIMSEYAFVIANFITNEIIDIYPNRKKAYLSKKFSSFSKKSRDEVDYIIIDMWPTYLDLSQIYFKNAAIAIDSFHVIKNLNKAMTTIRIKVMNRFRINEKRLFNNDMYYYMLKKFHYFFTKDFTSIYSGPIRIGKIRTRWDKYEILKYLLSIDADLENAYYLKESYREFNLTADLDDLWDAKFNSLVNEFLKSPFREFRDFGRLLENWQAYIKNSFLRIGSRRLSNGPVEGINSRIKTIIKNSNGFKNFRRLRNRIIYSINNETPILGVPKKIVPKNNKTK